MWVPGVPSGRMRLWFARSAPSSSLPHVQPHWMYPHRLLLLFAAPCFLCQCAPVSTPPPRPASFGVAVRPAGPPLSPEDVSLCLLVLLAGSGDTGHTL